MRFYSKYPSTYQNKNVKMGVNTHFHIAMRNHYKHYNDAVLLLLVVALFCCPQLCDALAEGNEQCGPYECSKANQTCILDEDDLEESVCICKQRGFYHYKVKDPTTKKTIAWQCQDFDECGRDNGNECSHTCVNTLGSYRCQCPPERWYMTEEDPHTCQDMDECIGFPTCVKCVNTPGSYYCEECTEGWQVKDDIWCYKPPSISINKLAVGGCIVAVVVCVLLDIFVVRSWKRHRAKQFQQKQEQELAEQKLLEKEEQRKPEEAESAYKVQVEEDGAETERMSGDQAPSG